MDRAAWLEHTPYMAGKSKLKRYLREWRGEMTLEVAAAKVAEAATARGLDLSSKKIPTSHAAISRLESGKSGYDEITLELLAEVYGTHPIALLTRRPGDAKTLYEIYETLTSEQQRDLEKYAAFSQAKGAA